MKQEWSYWIAENTGWSNGISWFQTGTSRCKDKEDAINKAKNYKKYMDDPSIKHRVTHRIVVEEYFDV